VEDLSLRTEFRRALDVVAPPAPWLAANIRTELRQQRREQLARQKRWFGLTLSPSATRLLAIALIVVLMVAASGAFLAIHHFVLQPNPIHTHPGAVSRSCSNGAIDMITSKTGWQGTSRTTDGGITWRDVSPPPIPAQGKGGGYVCALDADHAWVTAVSTTGGCSSKGPCAVPVITKLFVMSTADGGATWQTSQLIQPSGWISALDFFDASHGWLLTDSSAYSAPKLVRELYASSDGGINWKLIASGTVGDHSVLGNTANSCSLTGMTFSSLTTGWLTWDCSQETSPQTSDALVAVTREAVNLPSADTACGAAPPIFSAKIGMLLVTCPAGDIVDRTTDEGRTWLAGAIVQGIPTANSAITVDLVDGTTGFYFTVDKSKLYTLHSTTDGGRDWSVVGSGLFAGRTVNDFQFIDGATGIADVSNSPVAWVTHDGGKTWALPPPFRSIGNQVCNVPTDPGAGVGPTAVKMINATTGWAAGARRTTNGGADWTRVAPSTVPYRSGYGSEFFLDATHAWVAEVAGSSTACADRVIVFSTADGGATWQHGAPLTPTVGDVSIGFIDASNGWLLVGSILYRTTDAGRTWLRLAGLTGVIPKGCTGGPMVFASATSGWLQIQCGGGGQLIVTHDGGVSWTGQLTQLPCCGSSALPTFFDPTDGMAVDWNVPQFEMTTNGGITWVKRGLPKLSYHACTGGKGGPSPCTNQNFVALDFINPNHGWAIVTSDVSGRGGPFTLTVDRTEDGGKTWANLKANLPRINTFSDPSQWNLTFVDADHGFLWYGRELFATSNGGRTWTAVHFTYS
jgi:photosystem II stability/assembly factor-like uncharacterized protein